MSEYPDRIPKHPARTAPKPKNSEQVAREDDELLYSASSHAEQMADLQSGMDTASLSPRTALHLQSVIGNRAVDNMINKRDNVTTDASDVVIRREEDDNYVGSQPDSGMTETLANGSEVAPGQKGFSQAALANNAEVATVTLEGLQEISIPPVELDLSNVDDLIDQRIEQEEEMKRKKEGETIWGAPGPYFQKYYSSILKEVSAHKENLTMQKVQESSLVSDFNTWASLANQMYVSSGKLAALQLQFGATDNESLIASLEQGLDDAATVAADTEVADIQAPESDETVTQTAARTERARERMQTAWLGFKRSVVEKEREDMLSSITDDETQLKKINEIIATFKQMGKTVDLSMSVMSGMKSVAAAGPSVNDAGEWSNNMGSEMKSLGKTTAGGIGIPTSVEGIAGGIVELVYSDEIKKIKETIRKAKSKASALSTISSKLDLQQDIETYEDAVKDFEAAAQEEAQATVNARRLEYLRLGQQLDREATSDRDDRRAGLAPERGEERYAAIMLFVATIREVLAMGKTSTSTKNFKRDALYDRLKVIEAVRETRVKYYGSFSLSEAELEVMNHIYHHTTRFHNTYETLEKMFSGIESRAGKLMKQLNPGTEQGDY